MDEHGGYDAADAAGFIRVNSIRLKAHTIRENNTSKGFRLQCSASSYLGKLDRHLNKILEVFFRLGWNTLLVV